MVNKVIAGIIRGTDNLDLEPLQDITSTELRAGQLLICFIPNLSGSILAEELVDAEVTL